VWQMQEPARLMPSGTIAYQNGMRAWCDLRADLLQVLVHRLGIDGGYNDGRADRPGVTDRAEQVGGIMAIVAHHRRTRADWRPDVLQ
jgi:hypothetical protein